MRPSSSDGEGLVGLFWFEADWGKTKRAGGFIVKIPAVRAFFSHTQPVYNWYLVSGSHTLFTMNGDGPRAVSDNNTINTL